MGTVGRIAAAAGATLALAAWGQGEEGTVNGFQVELFDLESSAMEANVPTSVLLPPGFDRDGGALPLVVWLHGGGGGREQLPRYKDWLDGLIAAARIPPVVLASFSSTPFSGFLGPWEEFIADELPKAMAERYGARTDRDGLVIAGVSMGGYGALKSAFRSPTSYIAVAAMEPALEPTLKTLPNYTRNTWTRGPAPSLAANDNPARLAHDNAAAIRDSGVAIYLEVGDEDYLNLHDGTEFVHRVLWDHDIRHEYHLVRWADHAGASMRPRFEEMFDFIAQALSGGRNDPVELPLTDAEQELLMRAATQAAAGETAPELSDYLIGPRGPTVHAAVWLPLREAVADAEDMARAYAELPPTSLDEGGRDPGLEDARTADVD